MVELTEEPGTVAANEQRANFLWQIQQTWNLTDIVEYNVLSNGVAFKVLSGGEWTLADMSALPHVKQIWPATAAVGHTPIQHTSGSILFNVTSAATRKGLNRRALQPDPNGVKIGIIDSGIDYLHPDLGGCFGPGCLVAYGYDFVGDAYNGMNRAKPDSDPMDECNGHGTHVAGIIASGADRFSSISALGAYRVLGCRGKTSLSVLVRAMERVAVDDMQIVNISIGSGLYYASYPDAIMAQKLAERGILVIASAGNDGDLGMGAISSPATAPGVIAVASLHSEK
ncbi:peptidase S8/S53 domain-containing protein, partial [Thamnocephalis sphaerospora]